MNLGQIKKNRGWRVQLIPIAYRLDKHNRKLPSVDDDWIIQDISDTEICISNEVTGHRITLGADHIHHFTTNPPGSSGGINHGFLTLNVQVFLSGTECWVRPNSRPGDPVKPQRDEVVEKWVDLRYPVDSGIQQKIEADGYRVAWSLDTNLARRIDLEGWEIVIEPDAQGAPTKFRVKDRPADQTLIKIKNRIVAR
jgi:hypothetical protein